MLLNAADAISCLCPLVGPMVSPESGAHRQHGARSARPINFGFWRIDLQNSRVDFVVAPSDVNT